MSTRRLSVILFCFFSFSSLLFAQKRVNKQLISAFEAANRTLPFDYQQALNQFYSILKKDSTFAPAYMRIGQILEKYVNQKEKAVWYYEKAIRNDTTEIAFKRAYEIIGCHYLAEGHYQKAERFFRSYLKFAGHQAVQQKSIERFINQCVYAQKIIHSSTETVKHTPLPIPANESFAQSYPVFTADLKTLIFTQNSGEEDLMVTYKEQNQWTNPKSISTAINTEYNEGTCSISADGNTLVFAACKRSDGYGSCDLYISKRRDRTWEKPQNLGLGINTPYWESQPGLSADGRTLYFSSDRPGGEGGKDIWITRQDAAGIWALPRNLGKTINTAFHEISPFIHANGESLFFSSDGREGMGGFDIYLSKLTSEDWTIPIHLGYPLNDFADQQGFYIAPDCVQTFYTHEIKATEAVGKKSILCQWQLPDTLAFLCPKTYFIKGKVTDADTHKPLKASLVIQKSSQSAATAHYVTRDSTGEFMMVLPDKSAATLFVESTGYYPESIAIDSISLSGNHETVIRLHPFSGSHRKVFSNVLFVTGKAELEEISHLELNRVVRFLQNNPTVKLLIEGHTDDVGNTKHNETLSLNRAQQVVNYLVTAGINPERLQAKGYGNQYPLIHNKSEEARRRNRRVSWRVIE